MSFLTPWFLLGGLALALPVVFHLIRRTTRERTVFSSLMFLLPTPPRLTRKSRLEDLLLLLLRCFALGLLALGFARPFLKRATPNDPAPGQARRLVVLLDVSASMRRTGLWSAARDQVDKVIGQTLPADQVAVFTFDRQVTPLVSFAEWGAASVGGRGSLVSQRLGGLTPGWGSTQLGEALMRGAEALAEVEGRSVASLGQIVVVSDLQEGSRLEGLQAYEWPKGVEVVLATVKPKNIGDASVQLVADSTGAPAGPDPAVRVRVSNAADSKREQFQVGWAQPGGSGFAGAAIEVYVPPGQSRIVSVPVPAGGVALDRVVLRGDLEDFDNTVFVAPPEVTRATVLYLGSETAADIRQPLYFLERALPESRRQAIQVLARSPESPLQPAELAAANLVFVTEELPAASIQALRAHMRSGKTVIFAPKNATAGATLSSLAGSGRGAFEEAHPNNYAMLSEIDFRHPLFAPFADARFNDFTKIHFWKYRHLDSTAIPEARVVARFDNGDPAFLDVPVGRGRLLVLASGWNPDDSQFALSTKFVPWLFSLLELGGGAPAALGQFVVGDAIPASVLSDRPGEAITLVGPGETRLELAAGATSFSGTRQPGIYRVTSAQPPRRFAVNLDAAEARTAPLPADELERLGAPGVRLNAGLATSAARKALADGAALESRQKLWRWFIVATLAALLIESALAGWTARRVSVPTEVTV